MIEEEEIVNAPLEVRIAYVRLMAEIYDTEKILMLVRKLKLSPFDMMNGWK